MAYSKFDDVALPSPPVFKAGEYLEYVDTKLPTFLKSQHSALLDFILAVQSEFLVGNEQIFDLSAEKISSNTQFTNNVYVGAESKIALNGPSNTIEIKDSQDPVQTRVKLGKLGSGTNNYGIQVMDASGTVKFQTGSSVFIDGGIISADSITATQIAAGTITATELAANSVTADEISATTLSAITANLGSITAGSIDGATITGTTMTGNIFRTAASGARIQFTSTGLDCFKADGTQTIDIDNDGKFRFGPSGGNNIYWDNSTLAITGSLVTTGNITEGAVTTQTVATPDLASNESGEFALVGGDHPTATGFKQGATVTSSENTVAELTVSSIGRDILIFFNPIVLAKDVPNETGITMQILNFDATLKIKKGSTVLAQGVLRGGSSTASNNNSIINQFGHSLAAIDVSPNGSLGSAANTVYTCTLQINDFTTNNISSGIGYNKKSVEITGNAIAVEMRV